MSSPHPNTPAPGNTEVGLWLRQVNAFVGRQEALDTLDSLLEGSGRLVTLFGAAGVGKTRLCAQWLATRGRRALVCELEHAQTAQHIWAHLGEALGLREVDESLEPVNERILRALAHTDASVILVDNFEHLAEHGAVLRLWLARAPQHSVVVCSRRRLRQRGWHSFELQGLCDEEGVSLFESRAEELQGHPPGEAQRPATEALVRRLEGNPLAIELAASQILLSDPEQILASLDGEFLDMPNAWDDVPQRQRSLRDAMSSTWAMLDSDARALWMWVSQYEGAFSLGELPIPSGALSRPPRAILLQLRNHCLLRPVPDVGSVPLFKLSAVARHFGRELLSNTPEVSPLALDAVILEAASDALEEALLTEEAPQRSAFSLRIPDLIRIGACEQAEASLSAATLLQRSRRRLRVLGRDESTALEQLQRLALHRDTEEVLAAEVEILWGHLSRGDLDMERLQTAEARAEAQGEPLWQGELALLRAHWSGRDVHLAQARVECARAVGFYQKAGSTLSTVRALIDELRFAFHLILSGVISGSDLRPRMALVSRLCAELGTPFYLEKLEQLRGLELYCQGDHERALRKVEQGLERTAERHNDPVRLQWRHYHHGWLIRNAEHQRAVDIGWAFIDESKRAGVLVETLVLEQSMALAATGNLSGALDLIDAECDPGSLGAFSLGPIAVLRALGALDVWELGRALEHCREAIGHFTQTDARTRLCFALGLRAVLHALQDDGELAARDRTQARALLTTFDPEQTTARACSLDCFELLLDDLSPTQRAARLAQLKGRASRGLSSMIAWVCVEALHERLGQQNTAEPSVQLTACERGSWFEVPGKARVDLSGRTALRLLLAEMLRRHRDLPGEGLDMYALMEIGWPDEVLSVENGPGRVRAAIHTLRSLGLRGLLVNNAGYQLDQDAIIDRVGA